MMNVAEHLKRMATDHPEQIALQIPKRSVRETGSTAHHAITFQQLHRRTDALAHGLKSLGIDAGTRTVLMVPPSLDFFALTFALFRITAIPVFIDPGMGIKNLKQCIDNAEPTAFLGIAKAHLARRLLGWGKRSIRITVNVGRRRFFCDAATDRLTDNGLSLGDYPSPIVQRETQAAILFTSGSTGIAKGVEYTHGIFASQIDMLQAIYNIEPGEIDFCTFPLFALFGPALGMSCIIPDMNPSRPATINPLKASAQIAQFQATNMFGSPAVLKALSTGCQSQRLQSLRRVISAGAPATASTLEKLTKLLPKSTPIYTPYGATEALPIANISSEMILHETRQLTEQGHGVCIGKPVPGIEVSVITIRDDAIETWDESLLVEQGTIGEFVVRGPIVTQRYYNKPDATKLAKIYDPATGEILHRMGDVGYIDDKDRYVVLWAKVASGGHTIWDDVYGSSGTDI